MKCNIIAYTLFAFADTIRFNGASLDFTFDFNTVRLSENDLRFHDSPKSLHFLPLFRLLPENISQKAGSSVS